MCSKHRSHTGNADGGATAVLAAVMPGSWRTSDVPCVQHWKQQHIYSGIMGAAVEGMARFVAGLNEAAFVFSRWQVLAAAAAHAQEQGTGCASMTSRARRLPWRGATVDAAAQVVCAQVSLVWTCR